ncbi:MAG: ISL3 family transposase [Saprospiraceae bacterium]
MELTNFYAQILGIKLPWQISDAKIDSSDKSVHITVSHGSGSKFPCKHCQNLCPVHDHGKLRTWRHLDTCDHYTYLHASVPRIKCLEHGVCTIEPSWSRANSRFTLQFESFIIDTLQSTQVRSRSALQLRVSVEQLKRIQKQAVERGLSARKNGKSNSFYIVRHVCIDEKSLFTGHHYVSILYNGQTGSVLEVVEHRTQDAAQEAFTKLGEYVDLQSVQVVTMDMWRAFFNAAKICVPQADIVHDRFHLAQYLNNAVDITRRAENKKLRTQNDDRLKGTKYIWLKNPNNLTDKQQQMYDRLIDDQELKTVKAWTIKENFKKFFDTKDEQEATNFFNNWVKSVEAIDNKSLLKVVKTFKNHLQGLIDYTKHRVTNAMAESVNTAIQQVKSKARGFKSAQAFRIAILFHLGALDLYP